MNHTKILLYDDSELNRWGYREKDGPLPPRRLCVVIRHSPLSSITVKYVIPDVPPESEEILEAKFADTVRVGVLVEFIRSQVDNLDSCPTSVVVVYEDEEYMVLERDESKKDRFFWVLGNLLPLISSKPVFLGEEVVSVHADSVWENAFRKDREYEKEYEQWKKRKEEEGKKKKEEEAKKKQRTV